MVSSLNPTGIRVLSPGPTYVSRQECPLHPQSSGFSYRATRPPVDHVSTGVPFVAFRDTYPAARPSPAGEGGALRRERSPLTAAPGEVAFDFRSAPGEVVQTKQARAVSRKPVSDFIGGADRDRTDDLMTASHALSQLSYSPTAGQCGGSVTKRRIPVKRKGLKSPRRGGDIAPAGV